MKISRWLILVWILGILFPMAFLARLWPAFGTWFDQFFATNTMHVIFHACLYAILAVLLAQWIAPRSWKAIVQVLGLALIVGIFHEGIQVTFSPVFPGWGAEFYDLAVDVCGAAIGMGFLLLIRSR